MITTLPTKPARSTTLDDYVAGPRTVNNTLSPDYQLLGLRPREARVDVIREAVHQAASQVQTPDSDHGAVQPNAPVDLLPVAKEQRLKEQRLSEIAVAGYRLLDPRRRRTLFERVQLLMWTEEELDVTLKSLWAVQPEAPPKLRIQLNNARRPSNASELTSSEDENQVALELFRTIRQRDRRALALWVGVASLTLSLAAALGLFAIFA